MIQSDRPGGEQTRR